MCNYLERLEYIYAKEKFLIFLALAAVVIILVREILYFRSLKYKVKPAIAIVTETDYVEAYTITTMVKVGKSMIPQNYHHPEEFRVYAEFNGEIYCIYDEELFYEVDVGEEIQVWVHEGYNKRGKIENIYLSSRE